MFQHNNIWGRLLLAAMLVVSLIPGIAFATTSSESTGLPSLTLNQSTSVTLQKGGSSLFSFTPPADGWYCFESSGNLDPEGVLYSDRSLHQVLAYGSDNSVYDYNFSFSCQLDAGQTVYLRVYLYSSFDQGSFSVSVNRVGSTSLQGAYLTSQSIEWDGSKPITLNDLMIHSADGILLVENEDIIASAWYDSNGLKLSSAPSSAGLYSVNIAPASNSSYSGSATVYFELYKPNNLSSTVVHVSHDLVIVDGAIPTSEISVYDNHLDEMLEEGVDYIVDSYCTEKTYGTWTDSISRTTGYHCANLTGKGSYTGRAEAWFYAYDGSNISNLSTGTAAKVTNYACLCLTADESGYYHFSSSGTCDSALCVYDDEAFTHEVASDDNSGSNGNFSLVYHLEENETAYLLARTATKGATGSFNVSCEYLGAFGFLDTPANAWYVTNGTLEYVLSHGIMSGMSETSFAPNGKVTRAQVAAILYNLAEKPEAVEVETFTDVKSTAWYYNAVTWARSAGVISGYGNGKFGPNDAVTREQLACMLRNYAQNVCGIEIPEAAANALDGFADSNKVSSWAVDSIAWCVERGIISGKPSGNSMLLSPKGTATRAEAAQMVRAFDEKVLNA